MAEDRAWTPEVGSRELARSLFTELLLTTCFPGLLDGSAVVFRLPINQCMRDNHTLGDHTCDSRYRVVPVYRNNHWRQPVCEITHE